MSRVVNFGCRLNNFEGKKIEELLSNNNENIIVINSCSVTNETERQVRQTIRKIKKENPDKKIVITAAKRNMKCTSLYVALYGDGRFFADTGMCTKDSLRCQLSCVK